MEPLHTANISDFALWSLFLQQEEDQTPVWSEVAGGAQPPLDFNRALGGFATDTDWDLAACFENPPNGGINLSNLEATGPTTFNPTSTISDNCPDDPSHPHLTSGGPWLVPSDQALTSTYTITSIPSDVAWSGRAFLHTQAAAMPYSVPIPSGSFSQNLTPQEESAWPFESGQSTLMPQVHYSMHNRTAWQAAPGYSAGPTGSGSSLVQPTFPTWQMPGGLCMPSPRTGPDAGPSMSTSPRALLGKRHRSVDNRLDHGGFEVNGGDGLRPYKKRRSEIAATNGVLEGGGSTSGTLRKPTARALANTNSISKAAGRGAERLRAHSAQGLYHRSSQGPSVQQDLIGMIVPEQLPSIEGSVEGAMWHQPSSMVPQEDGELDAAEGDIFYIPRRLEKRHRALLDAKPADWARGTIRTLKCRLCPEAGFKNWADFKRHCDQMEAHPRAIEFCEDCGDFFAHPDSLMRHRKSRPRRCIGVDKNTAIKKRRETIVAFEDFRARLEQCLETGEDIGMPFSQRIMERFPESSKRGSRQQSRL